MEAYNFGYCLGVEATYANTSGSDFCPPDDYPMKSTLELVVKFVKDHPELEEKYPADIVRWALSDEFP
jgi:Rap1a immunity proteins